MIDSDIIDNVIDSSTSSYDKIIEFIDTITSATYILDLCYFWNNGENWEVFLLLPKCGCIPGTYGDNCDSCQIDTGTSRQTFQPDYNQEECIPVPTNIQNGSYTIIQDSSSIYNIGVSLNAGWAMDSSGISYVCAEDTYNASTPNITNQIVNDSYTAIDCEECPDGSWTQDRDPVIGATAISDCTVKFGYTETSPATTPATYEHGTGYEDVDADGTIDCEVGYYFDGTSCVECPTGHYCTGGIAQSGVAGRAKKRPCPIGTYNSNVRSIDENACNLIDRDTETQSDMGLGYFGTTTGATSNTHGFQLCPQNTHIDGTSLKDSRDNCLPDDKYDRIETTDGHTSEDSFIIQLKPQYSDENTCLPGAIKIVTTSSGSSDTNCDDPPTSPSFDYDNPGQKYLSGTSSTVEDCVSKPTGSVILKNCDAYTNSIVNTVSNVRQSYTGEYSNIITQCNLGYKLVKEWHFMDITDPEDQQIIDTASEFYLYQYSDGVDIENNPDEWTANTSNYHLNAWPEIVTILKKALNNGLKIDNQTSVEFIKWAIEKYNQVHDQLSSFKQITYSLLFYHDIEVYERDRGKKTMRYIYGILPGCQECPSGFTSDGYNCSECPAGKKQVVDGVNKICTPCLSNNQEYQDKPGQDTCKPLPGGDTAGWVSNGDADAGYTDFRILSGYSYDTSVNTVNRCPGNTRTENYQATGEDKNDATDCTDCSANQVQKSNGYECSSCPSGEFMDTSTGSCQECSAQYGGSTFVTGLGVSSWTLRTSPTDTNDDKTYCKAQACHSPLYRIDASSGWCEYNQCDAGQFYNSYESICKDCPEDSYCPDAATTINTSSSPAQPEKTACPSNSSTLELTKKQSAADCYPDEGYWNNSGTIQECPVGYYCPGGKGGGLLECPGRAVRSTSAAGSTGIGDCTALEGYYGSGNSFNKCSAGYYCPNGATSPIACPFRGVRSTSAAGSTSISDCASLAGYYRTGNTIKECSAGYYCPNGATSETACPSYTTSPVASTTVTACVPELGYYGAAGVEATPCPGVSSVENASANYISTDGDKLDEGDCLYGSCPDEFRNEILQCTAFNTTSSCPADQIFVPGTQIGTGGRYSLFSADIVSDYGSTDHVYGHNNMCLPISEICT